MVAVRATLQDEAANCSTASDHPQEGRASQNALTWGAKRFGGTSHQPALANHNSRAAEESNQYSREGECQPEATGPIPGCKRTTRTQQTQKHLRPRRIPILQEGLTLPFENEPANQLVRQPSD